MKDDIEDNVLDVLTILFVTTIQASILNDSSNKKYVTK